MKRNGYKIMKSMYLLYYNNDKYDLTKMIVKTRNIMQTVIRYSSCENSINYSI